MPNGVAKNSSGIDYWTPPTEGRNFQMSQILAPLEPFRDRLLVVSGLDQNQAEAGNDGASGDHTRGTSSWLTGVYPKRTEGADVRNGISADQIAAPVLGKDTALPSLELAHRFELPRRPVREQLQLRLPEHARVDVADNAAADREQPAGRVRAAVRRRRNRGAACRARAAQPQHPRFGARRLQSPAADGSGPAIARSSSEWVDAVREVERRISGVEKRSNDELPTLERPTGVPERFDEHVKLMYELQWLAFRADLTRVVTFMLGRELNFRTYPEIGVTEGHHGLSHHRIVPSRLPSTRRSARIRRSCWPGSSTSCSRRPRATARCWITRCSSTAPA